MRIEHTLVDRVLELAVRIQQISAPTFAETRRAGYVHDRFLEEGLADVSMDSLRKESPVPELAIILWALPGYLVCYGLCARRGLPWIMISG